MSRVEVLVATINQVDLSLFYTMNIQTDVIFCNQCEKNEFIETVINGCRVRMLSTTTRGVSVNRNLAMQLSEAEICLCADDDVVYVDGYAEIISNEYDKTPKAHIIAFNLEKSNGQKYNLNKKVKKTKHCFGTPRLSFKNKNIKFKNINFCDFFGSGSKYYVGEDTLFCVSSIRNGLRMYSSPTIIGKLKDKQSTWFEGKNEKYYYVQGASFKYTNRFLWFFIMFIFIYKSRKNMKISFLQAFKWFYFGAKNCYKMIGYEEFIKRKKHGS